jgi:hypothetical protein
LSCPTSVDSGQKFLKSINYCQIIQYLVLQKPDGSNKARYSRPESGIQQLKKVIAVSTKAMPSPGYALFQ